VIDQTMQFISPVRRGRDTAVATREPSHIHIPRPSRLLRRDTNADSSHAPTDPVRDLAAAELSVQAA